VIATVVVVMIGAAFWYYRSGPGRADTAELGNTDWLELLYSQNPSVADDATAELEELGTSALPHIEKALTEPAADVTRRKAALKAAGLLGAKAAPLVSNVARHLTDPRLTAEAAVALSFMGREAFGPLQQAAGSGDPVVRREALRSIGKLRERAPLDARDVMPLLLAGLTDEDAGVRVVAATYLGILTDDADAAVPALIAALRDDDPEVRAAAATALGSFGEAGTDAIPALRKAAGDGDEDVSREAGLALVKLQSSSRR
jgi:HEAT repeat protein